MVNWKSLLAKIKKVEKVSNGTAQLVFDQTPFYAEMGGQVADHGFVKNKEGDVVAEVTDVQHAPHGQNLHTVNVLVPLKVGQTYHLEIDEVRRNAVVKNHTATHLLHAALHNIVGEHASRLVHSMKLISFVLTSRIMHKLQKKNWLKLNKK